MWSPHREEDTICALATPQGYGGIGVIRVSGNQAQIIVQRLCPWLKENLESHRVYFGTLQSLDHENIDEVLITFFAQGKSFTGEETIEISCHGNPVILTRVLSELVRAGAKIAEKGEFSFRSFMNGKMDLVQVESVLSLIESQSQRAAQLALRQLKGELSTEFEELENKIIRVLAHIEASIDFTAEDIDVLDREWINAEIKSVQSKIRKLTESYKAGRIIKEGFVVALMGKPNVGKSSLLNALINEEKAIVTNIPGTTRDIVEGKIIINGIVWNFIDTAGLREATDQVEKIGIQKSLKAGEEADFIFYLHAADEELLANDETQISDDGFNRELNKKSIVIINKSDLLSEEKQKKFESIFGPSTLFVNCVYKGGVAPLLEKLTTISKEVLADSSVSVVQSRHYENLIKISDKLSIVADGIQNQVSYEFISLDLYECLHLLKNILGKQFDDDILDRIFKEFCIGK